VPALFLKYKNKKIRVRNKIKINLFIFSILLLAGFFGFLGNCLASEQAIIISSVQIKGEKADDDFIEFYNITCKNIDLSDYKVKRRVKDGGEKEIGTLKNAIPAKGYYLWENTSGNLSDNPDYSTKSYTLSDNYSLALLDKAGKQIDSITWGNNLNPFENTHSYSNNLAKFEVLRRSVDNKFSILLKYSPKNSSNIESDELELCPHEKPEEDTPEPEIKNYFGKLKINEIFPAPKTKNDEKEFVEIVNISAESVNLSGMRIEDEKKHKVNFPEKILAPKEIYFLEEKFELNNTSSDTAYLIGKDSDKNNPLDAVSYEKPKYDYSYAFNGSAWQWTSKITKGAENQFDEILSGTIKKDKNIYAGVYADFEAKVGDKVKKFTWDFGDGHKSYLRKTRHKYEKSGDYNASLKITGDGEDNVLNFLATVENFKKAKVQIASLSPNPVGKDSDNEWIEIFNNTKKKINLKNWSVATGWEKLSNHPIKKDFILKPKETKKLTRKFCAFALGNKQAKIELRYPNGKTADKIKYDRKKDSVDEDEIYQKEKGEWQWIETQNDTGAAQINADETLTDTENTQNIIEKEKIDEPMPDDAELNLSDLGKYSENPNQKNKRKKQIALLFAGSNMDPEEKLLQNQERVLGVSAIKKNYIKPEEKSSQNYSDKIWKKINARMNWIVSVF